MSFYDRPRETLERGQLRSLQEVKLRLLMDVLPRNEFYRGKFAAAGVDMRTIRALGHLQRVPFTTKAELLESQRRRPPYGNLLTYPLSRYRHLHQTSGTSGTPLLWLETGDDWPWWLRCWGQVYRGAGVGEDDVVLCAFSFGPFVAHWTALAGAQSIGALALPGAALSSRQRLARIFEHRVSVLVATPTYALHLAEVAAETGLDLRDSDARVAILAGEPGASVPNVKRRIEEAWGARVFDHAGATEVGPWGFDCLADDTDLHLNELELIFEVVDPQTGAPVGDGERGELVATNLGRFGMPVVRYRTGDLVVRTTKPCPCGRHMARLVGGVAGRADDMLVVRGVNVFPSAVDDLMRGIPEVAEYEVEIRTVAALDELTVRVETAPGASFAELRQGLLDAFRSTLSIRVDVAPAKRGSLPRYELKARRFRRIE